MKPAHLFLFVLLLASSPSLRAQECSGGTDGGMDATGSQCNNPPMALVDGASTHPAASEADPIALRNRGLELYERGQYSDAVDLFRRAGERGDRRSAEMIVLMHRFSAELFGGRTAISAAEANRWAVMVTPVRSKP